MNYSPTQRLAMAAALRAAKPFLSSGEEGDRRTEYICNALDQMRYGDHRLRLDAAEGIDLMQRLISRRLGNEGKHPCEQETFCTWLRAQGVPPEEIWWPKPGHFATPKTQAHRLAWMDLLIAELEAE